MAQQQQKPKMQKHQVGDKVVEDKGPPPPRTMTAWSTYEKQNIQMTLEQAVRDTIKNWDAVDFAVSEQWYAEPGTSGPVVATMKRCGYVPVLNKHGKFEIVSGMYTFTHVKPEA